MGKLIDITGQRFGKLIVRNRIIDKAHGHARWLCVCDCGEMTVANGRYLRDGQIQSCGCRHREITSKLTLTHGHARKVGKPTRTYRSWQSMKRRCLVPGDKSYRNYGGRGIKVCPEWMSFENFLTDMGECPPGLMIDRYPDNDGDYQPENCRWATRHEQNNNKRNTKRLTAFMIIKTQKEWEALLKLGQNTIPYWLNQGYDMEWVVRHFQRVG